MRALAEFLGCGITGFIIWSVAVRASGRGPEEAGDAER